MNPNARRLDRILADSPLAASLIARVAASRQAARVVAPVCRAIVPDFDPLRPGACELRAGILRIHLRSAAQGTKLRQALPKLMAALQSNSLEVSEIKICLQPGRLRDPHGQNARIKPAGRPDSMRENPDRKAQYLAAESFSSKLALTLQDGELRNAVNRLGRTVRGRLARMRESDEAPGQQNREESHAGAQSDQQDPARQPQP